MSGEKHASGEGPLIVFVCTGNVCRSPMAEYLLRQKLGDASAWRVMSAGLAAGYGMPASRAAMQVLWDRDIDLTPHRSRPLDRELVDEASLVVVMTASHREQIRALFPDATDKVFPLKSFDANALDEDVEDPIGSSVDIYRLTCREIDAALPGLTRFMETLF